MPAEIGRHAVLDELKEAADWSTRTGRTTTWQQRLVFKALYLILRGVWRNGG